MQPLTPEDVQAALDAQNTGIQIQYFEQSTATSEEAAAAANTALGSIVKSIVFIADTQPVLVLTSGDQRIDDRKIASHYNIGRKKKSALRPPTNASPSLGTRQGVCRH